MRDHLNGNGVEIIDISPMGCRTGFYMSLIGTPDEQRVADARKAAMADVLKVKDQNQIPELNVYQCGTYTMHSLEEAQTSLAISLSAMCASTATTNWRCRKKNCRNCTSSASATARRLSPGRSSDAAMTTTLSFSFQHRPLVPFAHDYAHGDQEDWHQHDCAQLLHILSGVVRVATPVGYWVVPPGRGVWLPAGTPHALRMTGNVAARTLFIDPLARADLPAGCQIVQITPLLRELIVSSWRWRNAMPPPAATKEFMN